MLPRRLGVRFALEALFLVVLAVAAGLAHLRPLYIVIVMAAAWLLVALAELTAERIDRSPVSYLLPTAKREEEEEEEAEEEERIFRPRPEERTVVAPPERPEGREPEEEPEHLEPEPEPEPAEVEAAGEPEAAPAEEAPVQEPRPRRRFRLRRRSQEPEPEPPEPPRHVKLLPRRTTAEASRASKEVAELFGSSGPDDERVEPEETRR